MIARPDGIAPFENVLFFDTLDSTQSFARRLVADLENDEQPIAPAVVVARNQVAGRGRGDRRWFSPDGGIYLSMVLPAGPIEASLHRSLGSAVVLAERLREEWQVDARVKWPNDLLVGGRKIAGLLLELVPPKRGSSPRLLIGIGMNLRADAFPETETGGPSTALDTVSPRKVEFDDVLVSILRGFAAEERSPRTTEELLARWTELTIHRPGDPIRLRKGESDWIERRFVGLDEVGRLRVDGPDGIETIASGEVG